MVKKNNSNEINKDSLDLKSHLDASFDYDNIKVSEELINKTLEAIKNSNNKEVLEEDNPKVTPFKKKSNKWVSTRRVAAAAAVLILFVAGYRVIDGGLGGKKSDQNFTMESAKDEVSILNKTESDNGSVEDFDISNTGVAENEFNTQGVQEEIVGITSDTAEFDKQDNSLTILVANTFSSLYSINPEQVKELTIENKAGVIKTQMDTKEGTISIINILDEQKLTITDIEDFEWSYKVLILTGEKEGLTILVGNGIEILVGEEASSRYIVDDIEGLKNKLEEFFNTMP